MTIWVVYLSSRSRFAVFSLSNHVKYAGRRTWALVIIHIHRGISMINTDITNKIKFFWLYSASYRTASSPSNSRCYNVLPDFPTYVNFQPWFFTVCQFPNLAFFFSFLTISWPVAALISRYGNRSKHQPQERSVTLGQTVYEKLLITHGSYLV